MEYKVFNENGHVMAVMQPTEKIFGMQEIG